MERIEVLSVDSIGERAECLPRQHSNFLLLLAWDAPEVDKQELTDIFRPLVDSGPVYFCAWGSNCEAVHDAVDQCDIEVHEEAGREISADSILLTTWHTGESLAEALWFFKVCALPAESFTRADCDRFAVAVGSSEWAAETKKSVESIDHDASVDT